MKILLLSMASPHFFNWVIQLKNSGHELYWLDVFGSGGYFKQIDFVEQKTGWRYRWDYVGRHRIKRDFPRLNLLINSINERKLTRQFEKELRRIKPDVVHSFVMYIATAPVLQVMKKHPNIQWLYSAWGSDMYYYSKEEFHRQQMQKTLPHINYMFADCYRDKNIARQHGFKGLFLGKFPGGGGYDLNTNNKFIEPFKSRNKILIKGYQGKHGKCIQVLEGISKLKIPLANFRIVIFAAAPEVEEYLDNSGMRKWENLSVYSKVSKLKVLELMGQSLIYIGSSTSDGTPNTLLEAITMESFPIQSNPGGATAEIIEHGKNGLLINDPEDIDEIAKLILEAISNPEYIREAIAYSTANIKPKLERKFIQEQVLEKYKLIEDNLKK
jgi:glycosyltransferase involved in cell wall biosynthesis